MSHVRNLDIRFMLLIGVMVGTIALLADWFLRISFWGGVGGRRRGAARVGEGRWRSSRSSRPALGASPIVGRLVMLAASRRREGLADVSAVELTRNPLGLAGALRKIADDPEVLEVANKATQHLYIVNPIKHFESDRARCGTPTRRWRSGSPFSSPWRGPARQARPAYLRRVDPRRGRSVS